jgi:hypothetical protein
MGDGRTKRLLRTEINWLSRGKVLKLALEMHQELQVYAVCSALPFVELLHGLSLLCTILGWKIFLVTECIELITAEKISQFFPTDQSECHHHEAFGKWIALTRLDRHEVNSSKGFNDFVVASGEDIPAQVPVAMKGLLKGPKNNFGVFFPDFRKIVLLRDYFWLNDCTEFPTPAGP